MGIVARFCINSAKPLSKLYNMDTYKEGNNMCIHEAEEIVWQYL